jgi:hypothetical protein
VPLWTDGEVVTGDPAIMVRKARKPLLVYGPEVERRGALQDAPFQDAGLHDAGLAMEAARVPRSTSAAYGWPRMPDVSMA